MRVPSRAQSTPRGCLCKAKRVTWLGRKAARRQQCWGAASDAFVLAELCSQLAASIGCLADPWHSPSAPKIAVKITLVVRLRRTTLWKIALTKGKLERDARTVGAGAIPAPLLFAGSVLRGFARKLLLRRAAACCLGPSQAAGPAWSGFTPARLHEAHSLVASHI